MLLPTLYSATATPNIANIYVTSALSGCMRVDTITTTLPGNQAIPFKVNGFDRTKDLVFVTPCRNTAPTGRATRVEVLFNDAPVPTPPETDLVSFTVNLPDLFPFTDAPSGVFMWEVVKRGV